MTRFVLPKVDTSWRVLPLGKLAQIKYGSALTASSRAANGEVPVYGSGGVVGTHDEALHTNKSIVVGRKGSVGSIFLTNGPFWCIDTAYYLDELNDSVNIEYLAAYLKFLDLSRLAISVAVPGLNRKELALVPIPLPTIPEQQRIVDILQQAEVTQNHQLRREHLDLMIKSALDRLVLTSDESEWELLGDLIETRYGTSISADATAETGVAVLRIPNVMGGEVDTSDLKYVSLTQAELERLSLTTADVVIVRSNGNPDYVGRSAPITEGLANASMVYASYLIRLRADATRLLPEYLSAFLNSAYGRGAMRNAIRTTAGQSNLSADSLAKVKVPIPSMGEQELFRDIWLQVCQLRGLIANSESIANELRDALIVNAVSGELTTQWRETHGDEIFNAGKVRDSLLRASGTRAAVRTETEIPSEEPAEISLRPARRWLQHELSEFQRQVLAAFSDYYQQTGQPLLVEDPEEFARFCDDDTVTERLQAFGEFLGNRIRRTLSQLAALGLIAKVTLPRQGTESGEFDYLKAFRQLRAEEFSRMADLQAIRKELVVEVEHQNYYIEAQLDFLTSRQAGAAGMFQVIALQNEEGEDLTDLIDVGKHYASQEELKEDIARSLKLKVRQIELEVV